MAKGILYVGEAGVSSEVVEKSGWSQFPKGADHVALRNLHVRTGNQHLSVEKSELQSRPRLTVILPALYDVDPLLVKGSNGGYIGIMETPI